jgi:hypothetical protein
MIVTEIRECLGELRTTLLRELATEIVPKFFSSNEFEILLWELDAHKLYLLSQQKHSPEIKNSSSEEGDEEEEDELVRNFNKMSADSSPRRSSGPGSGSVSVNKKQKSSSIPESIGPAVPDGAVQRLLRKVSPTLPSTITMHRAPLDLMDTVQQERDLWNDVPMGWILLYDSEGGRLQNPISGESSTTSHPSHSVSEKIRVIGLIPLHADKGQTPTATLTLSSYPIIPEGIVSFLLPTGRCIEEIKSPELPSPVLFNMALATRDNSIMYGGSLQLHRKESVFIISPESHPTPKIDSHVQTPSAIHRSHRPAPHTSKSTFKPLTSGVNSPTSPASGYTEWIGQMSLGFETMKNKSPLFDRFKDGITTFGAAVGNKQSPTVFPPKETKEEAFDRLSHAHHDRSSDHTQQNGLDIQQNPPCHKVMVDLHVVYGLSIISQVPCIDALRGPLSQLARDDAFLQEFARIFQEGKSGFSSSSSTWTTDLLLMTHETIENKHDSLKALRHTYHQYLSLLSTRIPSVMRWGGAHDFDARMILNTITPRNFVTILIAFILEYKIAVVSSKLTALTVMGEFLKSVIAPLKWSHVYVPLIPKQFNNDILQCPTPFFVGVQREFFDASTVPHDVILLDLDSDACRITADLAKALYAGRFLADALERVLRPALILCDEVVMTEHDSHLVIPDVLRLCKLFIADLLIGLEECCTHAVDHNELVVLFDEAMFSFYKMKRSKHETSMFPHDKGFLEQFMRTQCFSLCVVGNILKKLDPNSRPPSRPSSPFVSIPSPPMKPSPTSESALPSTPVQYS